jgi:hypothetical protein
MNVMPLGPTPKSLILIPTTNNIAMDARTFEEGVTVYGQKLIYANGNLTKVMRFLYSVIRAKIYFAYTNDNDK